jgi:hypothetical protein
MIVLGLERSPGRQFSRTNAIDMNSRLCCCYRSDSEALKAQAGGLGLHQSENQD